MRPLTSQFSASVGAARPGRIEDVRRRRAAHRAGDCVRVLEVCDERRDALVEILRAAAEARHVPAVREQPLGEVPSADARGADDERAPVMPDVIRHRFPLPLSEATFSTAGTLDFT